MDEETPQDAAVSVSDASNVDPVVDDTGTATEAATAVEDTAETFDRSYVEKLRDEAATHRLKAKRVDAANERLLASLVTADGRLVNPAELPLTDALLDDDGIVDPTKVGAAVENLIGAKPYLQTPAAPPPLPQGVRQDAPSAPSLLEIARSLL